MEDQIPTAAMIIGVDDSPGAAAALAWSSVATDPTRQAVCLVHVVPDLPRPPSRGIVVAEEVLTAEGAKVLERAEDQLRALGWTGRIQRRFERGSPAAVLNGLVGSSQTVVVGRRGCGGFKDLLVGSVAYDVVGKARGPVVVVPDTWVSTEHRLGQVILGVDSRTGDPALDFAFSLSARLHRTLEVVHICHYPLTPYLAGLAYLPEGGAWADDRGGQLVDQRRWLSERLAGWSAEFPDVPVEQDVTWGTPGADLVVRSSVASLIVVGTHDRGMLTHGLLGSVARTLMHHAECPVALVPAVRSVALQR